MEVYKKSAFSKIVAIIVLVAMVLSTAVTDMSYVHADTVKQQEPTKATEVTVNDGEMTVKDDGKSLDVDKSQSDENSDKGSTNDRNSEAMKETRPQGSMSVESEKSSGEGGNDKELTDKDVGGVDTSSMEDQLDNARKEALESANTGTKDGKFQVKMSDYKLPLDTEYGLLSTKDINFKFNFRSTSGKQMGKTEFAMNIDFPEGVEVPTCAISSDKKSIQIESGTKLMSIENGYFTKCVSDLDSANFSIKFVTDDISKVKVTLNKKGFSLYADSTDGSGVWVPSKNNKVKPKNGFYYETEEEAKKAESGGIYEVASTWALKGREKVVVDIVAKGEDNLSFSNSQNLITYDPRWESDSHLVTNASSSLKSGDFKKGIPLEAGSGAISLGKWNRIKMSSSLRNRAVAGTEGKDSKADGDPNHIGDIGFKMAEGSLNTSIYYDAWNVGTVFDKGTNEFVHVDARVFPHASCYQISGWAKSSYGFIKAKNYNGTGWKASPNQSVAVASDAYHRDYIGSYSKSGDQKNQINSSKDVICLKIRLYKSRTQIDPTKKTAEVVNYQSNKSTLKSALDNPTFIGVDTSNEITRCNAMMYWTDLDVDEGIRIRSNIFDNKVYVNGSNLDSVKLDHTSLASGGWDIFGTYESKDSVGLKSNAFGASFSYEKGTPIFFGYLPGNNKGAEGAGGSSNRGTGKRAMSSTAKSYKITYHVVSSSPNIRDHKTKKGKTLPAGSMTDVPSTLLTNILSPANQREIYLAAYTKFTKGASTINGIDLLSRDNIILKDTDHDDPECSLTVYDGYGWTTDEMPEESSQVWPGPKNKYMDNNYDIYSRYVHDCDFDPPSGDDPTPKPKNRLVVKKVLEDDSGYSREHDLSGFKFRLEGWADEPGPEGESSYIDEKRTTNSEGICEFAGIPDGTYTLHEYGSEGQDVIASWWTPEGDKEVSLHGGEKKVVYYKNTNNRGMVKVIKTVTDPSNTFTNAHHFRFRLEGTAFDGSDVEYEGTTDINGVLVFEKVPIGEYTLTEIGTPEDLPGTLPPWWDCPDKLTNVTVKTGETFTFNANNVYKTGNLTVTKTIEEAPADKYNTELELKHNYNNKLSGFVYQLKGISDAGRDIEEYAVTNDIGVAQFRDIPIGTKDNYTLVEVSASTLTEAATRGVPSAVRLAAQGTQRLRQYVTPVPTQVSINYNEETHSQMTTEAKRHNTLVKWRAKMKKMDFEVDEYRIAQGDATLKNAIYGLYDGDKLIDTYVTDENGEFVTDYYVLGDNWYFQEIKASEGYLIDPNKYPIKASIHDIHTGEEFNDAKVDIGTQRHNHENTLYEHAEKARIKYYKISGDTHETDKKWLEGAGFSVFLVSELEKQYNQPFTDWSDEKVIQWFYDNVRDNDTQGYQAMRGVKPATVYCELPNQDFDRHRITKNMSWSDGTTLDWTAKLPNEYLVAELFSDEDGIVLTPGLPFGRYILVETTVPSHHVAASPKIINIDHDQVDKEVYGDKASLGYKDFAIWDSPIRAHLQISKKDSATGEKVITPGAQYVIHDIDDAWINWYAEDATTQAITNYKRRWGDLIVETSNNNKGSYDNPYTTEYQYDADGDIIGTYINTGRELPEGRYVVEEVKAPYGYVLQGHEGLYRTDAYNGKYLYEVENWKAGKYSYYHQEMTEDMQASWIKNKKKASIDSRLTVEINRATAVYDPEVFNFVYDISQENDPAVGKLSIYKEGQKLASATQDGTTILERLKDKFNRFLGYLTGDIAQHIDLAEYRNYTFNYEYKPVEGAEFTIRAKEDIVLNGIRQFKKNDVVTTIRTDSEGHAWTEQIRTSAGHTYYGLPIGKYTVEETVAGNGFALSDENQVKRSFEITYDGETVPITYRDDCYVNPRQVPEIIADKYDLETKEKIGGAVFGLFTREPIRDYDGNVAVKKDTLVSIAETTSDEKAVFKNAYTEDGNLHADRGLPLGKYYIRELKAPKGYYTSEKIAYVDAVYNNNQEDTITFESKGIDDDLSFINEQTKLQINLMDWDTEVELDGATIVVGDPETGDKVEKQITVHNGNPVIRGLEIGKRYVVEEIKPAKGYTYNIYKKYDYTSPHVGQDFVIGKYHFPAHDLEITDIVNNKGYIEMPDLRGVHIVSIFAKPVKADLVIHKEGEVAKVQIDNKTATKVEYELKGLPNTHYKLAAAENIKHPDGYSNDIVSKGGVVVEDVVTDDNGNATISDLYLGKYKLTETKAPKGYVRDPKNSSYTIDLKAYYDENVYAKGDYTTEKFTMTQKVINPRQKPDWGNPDPEIPPNPGDPSDPTADNAGRTGVIKYGVEYDENHNEGDRVTVAGAEFALYAKEDIVDVFGEVTIPAGTLIETSVSGVDGKALFESDLPVGKYVVKETKPPKGYKPATSDVEFDFTEYEDNDVVKIVRFVGEFVNEKEPGTPPPTSKRAIEIQVWEINYDKKTTELPDVKVHLEDASGKVVNLGGKDCIWVSELKATGFKNVPPGSYKVVVDWVPPGYVKPTKPDIIKVKDIDDLQHFDIYIPTIKIDVTVIDKVTKDPVSGVTVDIVDHTGKVVYENVDLKYFKEYVPAGQYTIKVKKIPAGYLKPTDPTITVKSIVDLQHYIIPLEPIRIKVVAVDKETKDPIPEGVIVDIYDKNGNIVWKDKELAWAKDRVIPGEHTIKVTQVPPGYVKPGNVYINIKQVPGTQVFVVEVPPIKIAIQPYDKVTGDPVSGVKMHLEDSSGKTVGTWTSTNGWKYFKPINAGNYVIVVDSVSQGYKKPMPKDITVKSVTELQKFRVPLVRDGKPIVHIAIQPYDKQTGDPVPGAVMYLKDSSGKVVGKWTSTEGWKHFRPIDPGKYTIVVSDVPNGYKKPSPTKITVKNISDLQKYRVPLVRDGKPIVHIAIQPYDKQTGNPVSKVEMHLRDTKGNIVGVWTSTTGWKHFKPIKPGDYVIVVDDTPGTYKIPRPMKIHVKNIADLQKFRVPLERGGKKHVHIAVQPYDKHTGEPVSGVKMHLVDKNGNTVGVWSSDTGWKYFNRIKPGKYRVVVDSVPDGYRMPEPTDITVQNIADLQKFRVPLEKNIPPAGKSQKLVQTSDYDIFGVGLIVLMAGAMWFVYRRRRSNR